MRRKSIGISLKIGLLFSSIFLILLLFLGYVLSSLFSQIFVDYITQDLLTRGENHGKVLTDNFNQSSIYHVGLMEKNVVTSVVVIDQNKQVLTQSDPIDNEMKKYIYGKQTDQTSVLNKDWQHYKYIVTISPIDKGKKGFVYMFYPSRVLRETVLVLKGFIAITSIGVILIAIAFIVFLSRKMAVPLQRMKEATNKMAKGEYKQNIQVKGNDELAQLANSIKALGEQLQYYETTRNDFLANVSHELRTPLTYIKGYSDILAKNIISDKEEQLEYLRIINEESKRVTHLVNDLFQISNMKTGNFVLHKEPVKIYDVVKKVIQNLTPLAYEKELSISLDSDVPNLVLNIDPHRIEQVFFNLIENAIKYTDQGSVKVSIKKNKESVIMIVKDTGIGIPKDELSKVWDRFYRVEKSRARKTGGTGLGLYVVKEIIQLHQGTIEINSSEEKGTAITIILKGNDVVL